MIEINLVPDVKQDLIRARKVRNRVISGAVLAGLVSVGLVVILAVYLFAVQTLRSTIADKAITDKSSQLKNVPDLANMLTIQSQLTNISKLHDEKTVDSRLFDVLTAINPAKPNDVTFSMIKVDGDNKTIHLEGQAVNGFLAADVLKKTILATTVSYENGGKQQKDPLTSDVILSNLSYGEDSNGKKVLRFTFDFEYSDALFASTSSNVVIARPDRQNATDSFRHVPESLFESRAKDTGGSN